MLGYDGDVNQLNLRSDVSLTSQPGTFEQVWVGQSASSRRRPRHVRRLLFASDLVALAVAFATVWMLFGGGDPSEELGRGGELVAFVCALPIWLISAAIVGLYDFDDRRVGHNTPDELFGVVSVVTIGTWVVLVVAFATGLAEPQLPRLITFWALACALVVAGRAGARMVVKSTSHFVQRAVIVGAGDVGQLVARKLLQHPEYGIAVVGFLDDAPRDLRSDVRGLGILGGSEDLERVVREQRIDRVVVAFSKEPDAQTIATIRQLRNNDVVIDVVPRLFELVGPTASVHGIEGLSLVCLPPARHSRLARVVKRAIDLVGATVLLVLASPVLAFAALRIKLDSPGPVLFQQTRLGQNMDPFTVLKLRTMRVGTDEKAHRDFVRSVSSAAADLGADGMYKLSREDVVTGFGRFLRRTSLDELPQLINVLRGDMSLVGPRPCIPYEVENFSPHHFERFQVPQGITGMWQVAARANSTFAEALEMDVAYVRGWSLGLDVRLLLRTPFALLNQRRATA